MVIFERFQTVRRWLDVIENISRIVCMRHVSYRLTVNGNVSKMAFTQKIQVRLNREGGVYSSSRNIPSYYEITFQTCTTMKWN